MIILSNSLVLSAAEEALPDGTPWIGYHDLVETTNITSTTEEDGYPITNVANPATHLTWVSTSTAAEEIITITTNSADDIDYVGIAKHNFGSASVSVTIDSGASEPVLLLHFDGTDASITFIDSSSSAHTFTAVGNAQIDTAQFKFGSASGLFDGTGDYLTGDGSSDFAFGTGDFTIDCWVRLNTTGTLKHIYDSRPTATNGAYTTIMVSNTDKLSYWANGGFQITGTTSLTTGTWYHVALTRSGTSTRLFLNGTQEGSTYSDSTNYLNGTSRPAIGSEGSSLGSSVHDGWIDELRVLDSAAWTTTFTPPTSAHTTGALIDEFIPSDDWPIIARFTPQALTTVRIRLQPNGTAPQAAVIYVGKLLVLERSITIGRGHVPINYGRRTTIVNGMSESGNFLGRIVVGEFRESKAEFEWFTPDFYRSDIDTFIEAAQEIPFFWAWSPSEYPLECGYVWLTNNAQPETDPATRRVALTLEMRGVA